MKKLLQDHSRCWRLLPLIFTITRDFQPLKIVVTLLLKVGIVGTHPVTTRNIAFFSVEAKPLPLYHVPDFRSHQKNTVIEMRSPDHAKSSTAKKHSKKSGKLPNQTRKIHRYLLPKKVCKNRKHWRKKKCWVFFELDGWFLWIASYVFWRLPQQSCPKKSQPEDMTKPGFAMFMSTKKHHKNRWMKPSC